VTINPKIPQIKNWEKNVSGHIPYLNVKNKSCPVTIVKIIILETFDVHSLFFLIKL